jgi:hypothetical protein
MARNSKPSNADRLDAEIRALWHQRPYQDTEPFASELAAMWRGTVAVRDPNAFYQRVMSIIRGHQAPDK